MHICNRIAHLKVVQIVLGIFYELGGFFMRIYHAKDYADMSRKAANIVSAQVIMKPKKFRNPILIISTYFARLSKYPSNNFCAAMYAEMRSSNTSFFSFSKRSSTKDES